MKVPWGISGSVADTIKIPLGAPIFWGVSCLMLLMPTSYDELFHPKFKMAA
jgi:hypothetical protein